MKYIYTFLLLMFFSSCDSNWYKSNEESKNEKLDTLTDIYIILDNTGSTVRDKIGKVNIENIKDIITAISNKGGGNLWLNYVDGNTTDNPAIHFEIPNAIKKPVSPLREKYDNSMEYSKAVKQYRKDTLEFNKNISSIEAQNKLLGEMQNKINDFIVTVYSKTPLKSDCFGSLRTSIKAIESQENENKKFIFAFSDLTDDVSKNDTIIIPKNVNLYRIHHSTALPKYTWLKKQNDLSYFSDVIKLLQ